MKSFANKCFCSVLFLIAFIYAVESFLVLPSCYNRISSISFVQFDQSNCKHYRVHQNTILTSLYSIRKTKVAESKDNEGNAIVRASDIEEFNRKLDANKWKVEDSFNSTTFKLIFGWKEELDSILLKFEKQLSSWRLQVSLKVQRDIRTTLAAGDFITRKASKGAESVIFGVEALQRPLATLPEKVRDIVTRSDSWDLLSAGIDPTEKSSLIGQFDAATTQQRADRVRKKKALPTGGQAGAVDSLYRSVRVLPSRLQYDYQRRTIQRQLVGVGADAASSIARGLPAASSSSPSPSPYLLSDGEDSDGEYLLLEPDSPQSEATSVHLEDEGQSFSAAVAALFRLADDSQMGASALGWLRAVLQAASAVTSMESVALATSADPSLSEEGVSGFSRALPQLNASLSRLSGAVAACERLSLLGPAVLAAASGGRGEGVVLEAADVGLLLRGMAEVAAVPRGSTGSLKGEADWQQQLEAVQAGGVLADRWRELGQLLGRIQEGLSGGPPARSQSLRPAPTHVMEAVTVEAVTASESVGISQGETERGREVEPAMATVEVFLEPMMETQNRSSLQEEEHQEGEQELKEGQRAAWSPGALLKAPPPAPPSNPVEVVHEAAAVPNPPVDPPDVVSSSNDEMAGHHRGAGGLTEASPGAFELDGDFLRSIYEESAARNGFDISERMNRKMDGSEPGSEEASVVVETTAETSETREAQVVKFLITSLDVSLFLVESLAKAVGPIVMDGGALATARASQTLAGSLVMPLDLVKGQWSIYDQFKKPQEMSDDPLPSTSS